jgi:AraC-like DNA-binding protein
MSLTGPGSIISLKTKNGEFQPSTVLKPFVKSYSVITIGRDLLDEVFYPSGYIDFVVNVSGGAAATIINGDKKNTPEVELLGHLTVPTRLTVAKGTCVLIARFFPYAGPLFFRNPIADFTNYATNLGDVFSNEIYDLYDKLMHCFTIADKVKELDDFLVKKLRDNEDQYRKTVLTADICRTIFEDGEKFDGFDLSQKYGLSERYIQKLFLENVGISPASLFSITRFNKALNLVLASKMSLTSVAYDCGYYDQAHFIKEFKKFTGIKPSEARFSLTKNGEEFQQAVNIGF